MKDTTNINEVVNLGICTYMGFIFYEKSPRYIGEIPVPQTPPEIKRVGVFVNEGIEKVLALSKRNNLDYVQLHGNETPEYCNTIRMNGLKVIKAIRVGGEEDLLAVKDYAECADYLLFDTKSDKYGGTGRKFNWDLLFNIEIPIPFFISGGITPDNLSDLPTAGIKNLYGIDVNSGFEEMPGIKNIEKLKSLLKMFENELSGR